MPQCAHPTDAGPCRNNVTGASRCAAGHPARTAAAPAVPSAATIAQQAANDDPFGDQGQPLPAKTGKVTPGVIDDHATNTFMHGQCHALALAINEKAGWPIEFIGRDSCSYDEDCPPDDYPDGTCPCQMDHVVVRRPDGRMVDINGARSEHDVLADQDTPIEELHVGPVRAHDVATLHTEFDWQTPDVDLARTFVPLVAPDHTDLHHVPTTT